MPSVSEVHQFRQVTPDLATSGQPSEAELAAIASAGYEVIINLALHDDPRYSLPDETAVVEGLGMEYVHIPVPFDAPSDRDLAKFFEAMDAHKARRLWIHCAANLRVSAFLGLYRRMREGWPDDRAFELMHGIWVPNPVWASFIRTQVAAVADG